MNNLRFLGQIILFAVMLSFSACSGDDALSLNSNANSGTENKSALDFVAVLTPEQQANIYKSGDAFLPEQQKDSWNAVIDNDIPTSWGCFDSPFKVPKEVGTRAVGVWGSYPAQYWTMIRLKNGQLDRRILNAMILAVEEIESKTNVRFYNSSKDDESLKIGRTIIKLPNVKVNMMTSTNQTEGTGNFGLVGGEQIIYVPTDLVNIGKYKNEEVVAFLVHALCNAAGMFNEQQRKDRDDYVQVYLDRVRKSSQVCFNKQSKNYTMLGTFDFYSITLASSKSYSKDGRNTIEKKGNGEIAKNLKLSDTDISFLNTHYLPYISRTDNYIELDTKVYNGARLLTESERIQLQNDLNSRRGLYGTPPASGRKERKTWS